MYRLSDFDFRLPKNLIAQTPATPRNHSRLLVYDRQTKEITDDYFYNLDKYLVPDSALVLNNSKVEKARLRFGSTEIFVLETIDPYTIRALVKPGKKFRPGKSIEIDLGTSTLKVRTIDQDEEGIRTLSLSLPVNDSAVDKHRLTPLPPYIKQKEELSGQYQTVYAESLGSKAAPTAGLHFTNDQLIRLAKSHELIYSTLHVGLGTFAPVKGRLADHKMHSEGFFIPASAAAALNKASHITAVGTTSVRVLESAGPFFNETAAETNIFIKPGYDFKVVNFLITNFHLPRSTLLMLVAAFIGSVDELQRVYAYAVKEKYRFYSFGDAMLIL